ncbi:MAG TPA: terminase small subunit [Acidocella sp.]|nr:terminase small subunit [Acidocella sp.]
MLDALMANLTPKQRKFVETYLSNGRNASAAYRAAYNTKAAPNAVNADAQRLLNHPAISLLIASADQKAMKATEKAINRFEITQERVAEALAKIGFSDMRRVAKWTSNSVSLIDSEELSEDDAFAITEVSQGKDGVKIKLADKRAALVDLGKHLGMFAEKVDLAGKVTLEMLIADAGGKPERPPTIDGVVADMIDQHYDDSRPTADE